MRAEAVRLCVFLRFITRGTSNESIRQHASTAGTQAALAGFPVQGVEGFAVNTPDFTGYARVMSRDTQRRSLYPSPLPVIGGRR
jgi:hypothetical protein